MNNRVREIRKKRELSGIEVAKRLKISAQYLYDIEKGERRLRSDIASHLADLFNVSVDYLLGREESLNEDRNTVKHGCESSPNTYLEEECFKLLSENARLHEENKNLKQAIKNITKSW
jgi:transcriptional regulator with XRE-family HTH domain